MTQLTIPANRPGIEAAFWDFHAAHPEVYEELRGLARAARVAGNKRIAIKTLYEVVRWNRSLAYGEREFKLNNNWTAYYSRLLAEREPELRGVFATRRLGVPSHVLPHRGPA